MTKHGTKETEGAKRDLCSLFHFLGCATLLAAGACSLTVTRPVQEMSDTTAAIRAAKDARADVLVPELYRQSNEWFVKAKKEYKFKNFELAKSYLTQARKLAEQAEFQAIRNAGDSNDVPPDTTSSAATPTPTPTSTPYSYPTPQGTPAADIPQSTPNPQSTSQ